MNGSRYLLDTNTIIQLLKGNSELVTLVSTADFLATSIIAATARANGLAILTADDHFKPLTDP